MNNKEQYFEKIKQSIAEQGLSNYWIAKEAGISQVTMGRILSGKNMPSDDTIIKLLDCLKIEHDFISKNTNPESLASKGIGERLYLFCKKMNISPTTLMTDMGYSRQVYYNITRNGASPSADLVAAVVGAYPKLNARWLLCGIGEILMDGDQSLDRNKCEELLSENIKLRQDLEMRDQIIKMMLSKNAPA